LNSAVYRLRVFVVITFLQMVFQLTTRSGLAGQGHDALFVAAVHGAIVIVGHKEVAASLREMASMVEGKGVDTPQTAH